MEWWNVYNIATIIPIVKKLAGPSPRLFVADNEIVIAPLAFNL